MNEITDDPAALDPALAPQPVAEEPLPSSRRKVIITIVVVAVVAVLAVVATVLAISLAPKAEPVPAGGDDEPVAEQPVDEIDGIRYESGPYGYAVVFPGTPSEQVNTVPVQGVDVELATVIWEEGDSALISNAAKFPAEMVGELDEMLEGSIQGGLANIPGAELVSTERTTLAGLPAIDARATSPIGEIRMIVAFDVATQYQLLAAGTDEETTEAFIASFRLL